MSPPRVDDISRLRADIEQADTDVSQAAAVRSAVEDVHDRMERGNVTDALREAALETFERYVTGEDRRAELAYLTEALLTREGGEAVSVFDATLDPAADTVSTLAADLRTFVTGGRVSPADLTDRVEAILTDGSAIEVASLASLADRLVAAAKGLRADRTASLNDTGWTDDEGNDVGALTAFLDAVDDEVAEIPDQPIALFPVRLETRFVTPNDDRQGPFAEPTTHATRAAINRIDPDRAELRVRVYPDQIHVDTHEPELTDDEEAWGKNFWAQLWFACFDTGTPPSSEGSDGDAVPTLPYDTPTRDLAPDDERIHSVLADLSDRRPKFSRDPAAFHEEVKERAWRQLVDRFGRERGAYLVHELAPTERASDILVGWTGPDEATPPWPRGGPATEPGPDAPSLSFPAVDRRPDSWNQPPLSRLLPDRWLVLGRWREQDDEEATPNTVRTESDAIRDPLAVGPNPEAVAADDRETTDGDAPEGMHWMTDYEAALDAGMAVTITAEDLDGTDPRNVVFETLVVLGVSAARGGAESSEAIRGAFEAHHYTDGLAFLERGTPTNNHDFDSGYSPTEDPAETMRVECDAPLASFGDFSDGDIVSRALGIADPDGEHVFAHVEGADGTTQANARHMNSFLWPGTFGYYLRNILVSNDWTGEMSIWAGVEDVSGGSFPENPMGALGEHLKWLDAMRRHFIRYVRAGGPFPPIRVGRQPYGLLPVAALPDEDDARSGPIGWGGLPAADPGDFGDSLYAGGHAAFGEEGTTQPPPSDVTGAVSGTGYGIYTDATRASVNDTLYGSSYDPTGPPSTATRIAGRPATGTDDLQLTDGGVVDADRYIRPHYLQRDEVIPGQVASLVRKLAPAWRDSVNEDVNGSGTNPTSDIETILAREATADEYVEETVYGWDQVAAGSLEGPVFRLMNQQLSEVRRSLRDHDLTDLDPRLGWMLPAVGLTVATLEDGKRRRERNPDEGTVPWLIDNRAPRYLETLVDPSYGSGRTQLDSLRKMGYQFDFADITVDRETLRGVSDVRLPTNVDEASDAQLALYLTLTAPDHGKLYELFTRGVFVLSTDVDDEFVTYAHKGYQLIESDGLTLQNTLWKQLSRFSLLQGYVGARIRLGTMFDEQLFPEDGATLLAGRARSNQSPVPEPSLLTDGTRTVWEALTERPPDAVPVEDDTYVNLFWDTCRPGTEPPPIDPRLGEVFDSLAHLRTLDAETLGRLMGETLDVASHRLDAWWTSLATRRLYEQRERQEAAMYSGADYEYVGRHFRGAPGVAGDTPRERARNASPTIEGTGLRVDEHGNLVATDSGGTTGEALNLGSATTTTRTATTPPSSLASGRSVDSPADRSGDEEPTDEDYPEPATFVGAYGFVENLSAGDGDSAPGGEAEYIHAPSQQQATTAAILRSGRRNHADDEALAELLDVDLSPGRVRAARRLIDAVREGQQLGVVLGYRFERRLLERTRAVNEERRASDDGPDASINLVRYKWDFRRTYPGSEGKLDHGEVDPSLQDEAAKSDVVDGYTLYTEWDGEDTADFLAGVETEDGRTLDAELSGEERRQLVGILEELGATVDAVTDLLIAENVHQLGRGNFDRAGGTIDDLVKGSAIGEPEVTETPRTDVGVSHRQFVAFGAPGTEPTPAEWTYETPTVSPDSLPPVGSGDSPFRPLDGDSPTLQNRPTGEPNLNGWIGSLLPAPERVSCRATFDWAEDRQMAVGTVTAPDAPGPVSVTDVGFEPDLVELTVAHGVHAAGLSDELGTAGWSHGVAARTQDAIAQHAVSVDLDPDSDEGGGVVDSTVALRVLLHDADGAPAGLTADVAFLEEGFELDVDAVADRGGLPSGLQIQYRAYQLGNPVGVDVGHAVLPTGADPESIDVGVDADVLRVVGTTVSTGADAPEATTGTVGLSNGMAVRADSDTVSQHVVASGVDPATGDVATGARDDLAIVLPYVSGGGVAGTTAARVTSMGTSVTLDVTETHAGTDGDAARVITYVAIQCPEPVPAPDLLTVTPDSLSAGDEVTIPTDHAAGAIEVLATPGLEGTGPPAAVQTTGWSHGVATGVGAQHALSHTYHPNGAAQAGGLVRGDVVSVPAVAGDGSVTGETVLRVKSIDESEIVLSAVSVDGPTPALLVRAWPATPDTVTHTAATGATLDDLAVSPLDAVSLAQPRDEAGASELEKRFEYSLSRNRPTSDPPVPDRATLELAFTTLSPTASGEDPLTVAEFLEVARTVREVLGDGRPLDAEDLGHPGEIGGDGYTDETAVELADRALAGQRALNAAGTLLENRVARFDVAEDESTVTEAVADLREAVAAVRETVPVAGARHVGSSAATALGASEDALHADLQAVLPHLPAGETEPDELSDATPVYPLAGQPIDVRVDPSTRTEVYVWSTSGVERFSRHVTVPADGDDVVTIDVDFDGVKPGTPFAIGAVAGGDVVFASAGRVVLPQDDLVTSPAGDQRLHVPTNLAAGTTVSVTVESLDGARRYASESTTTDDFGGVDVVVDFDGVAPWEFFEVTVEEGDETGIEKRGYVAGDPGRAVADGTVLPGLLWLAVSDDAFDPYRPDTPAANLYEALEGGAVDWSVVERELDLLRDLEAKTPNDPPTQADIDTVAALVDEGDGTPALESLDLAALDAAVRSAGTELRRLGFDDLFGVSGRPDRAGALRFFANRSELADDTVQDRIAAGVTRPALLTDDELSEHGFAPSLERFLADEAAATAISDDDADQLRAYLAALADWLPAFLADLDRGLENPIAFARRFEQLVHDPESFPVGSGRATFEADFRRLTQTSVLDGVSDIDDMLTAAESGPVRYNIDQLLLGRSADTDGPDGADGADGEDGEDGDGNGRGGDDGGTPTDIEPRSVDEFESIDDFEFADELDAAERRLLSAYFTGDRSALETLRDRDFGPMDTPDGTGVTDLRFHLEVFRRLLLGPYLDRLQRGELPPDEADSKAAFAEAVSASATTLETTAGAATANLTAARGPDRFDHAFRRGVLETIRRALQRVSYFSVYASTPNSARGGTAEDERVLVAQARTVLQAVKDTYTGVRDLGPERGSDGTVTTPPSVDSQIERLETLYGEGFTVLPAVYPTTSAELTATFGRSDDLLGGDPLAAETWLQRISRVRDRPATFRRALSYAEAVTGERHRDLSVGQLPHRPSEEWVGLPTTDPRPGRLSLVAQFGDGFDGDFSGPVTGLFVDEHVENVPSASTTSGVALRYNDPDATAPHGVLLAVPPEDGGWSRTALESVLTDTIELLKLRLVDLQDLGDLYQLLPMVYLPDNSALQPETPTVDLDRISEYHDIAPQQWAEYTYRVSVADIGLLGHMGVDFADGVDIDGDVLGGGGG